MHRVAFISLAALALASGCGGARGSTPTPRSASETTTPPPKTLAIATPTVAGSAYRSETKGYSVIPPEGWTVQPNSVFDEVNSRYASDTLFAPNVEGKAQANISVTCQKLRSDQATLDAYRDAHQSLLRELNISAEPRAVSIDGHPAFAFDYTQEITTQQISVDKTDVLALVGDCRWLITLSVPAGTRGKYVSVFDQTLLSMRFL
jgi:hypothetical protein